MADLICPECGAKMVLRETPKYTWKDGTPRKFYGCSTYPKCRATHGAHPDGRPLGIPAREDVKKARIVAHFAFDKIWQSGMMTRKEAYVWLQMKLGMEDQPHIGAMDENECKRVEYVCTHELPSPVLDKYPRSPLRYPGGKNRAVKGIYPYIPATERVLCSPFLGGASVELACSTRMEVRGYDAFGPLVDFWEVLINDKNALADAVMRYFPLSRTKFYNLQKICMLLEDQMDRAAAFFVLNRSSFSGTTLSGGMSPEHPRFTLSSIQRLRDFDVSNFHVEKADFTESIEKNSDAFLYLDPPYLNGQTLYGLKGDTHKDFDHKTLSDILHGRDRWILSYNDCETIRKYYKDYQILDIDWTYGMNKSKISNEVLVISHDLETRTA